MRTKGYVRIEALQSYTERFGAGQVGSSGLQYSAAAPFGTVATAVFDKLIDPGFSMTLKELQIHLEHRYTNLLDAVGSVAYFWRARPEFINPQGSKVTGTYINLTGTYLIWCGSLANIVGTFNGYVPVGSVPNAPVRLQLVAQGLVGSTMTAEITNNSYAKLYGLTIPGC